ncbi:DUF6343 family protein [Kitasatospora sp. RB6PN24]|uniref:DUF6343 family protein n=1 Tax=Kitasatospora humi TaxID=2893891 RepID=UPI001E3D7F1B|nr:DUF6343 family protein [Kitasatospora humi]MCC9307771.1 DUF6343 family protein [Kitasatospora humi]
MPQSHHHSHHAGERWRAAAADRRARAAARRWQHTGTEPIRARSDLPARRLLNRVFLPLFAVGTVVFTLLATDVLRAPKDDRGFFTALAVICAVFTVVAVVDMFVIRRRMAEQQRWRR